ncbi:hypothetical protein GCK32_016363 [Trichostrongylus colubriformis]|uniref:Uncharacterized protein n=1 Tax=Trichostrongylus colubriformis TaxID=6319 RepID=A0AAN8FY51_TRICO
MLMFLLCFIAPAHAYGRNQDPTTLDPSDQGRIDVKPEGPIHEHDRLDDVTTLVYGFNVSVIQHVCSVSDSYKVFENNTKSRKWAELFHNHPGFGTERKFYVKVDRAVYLLAKSIWSKSTAREALVGYWLMLDKATRTKHNFDLAMRIRLCKKIPSQATYWRLANDHMREHKE